MALVLTAAPAGAGEAAVVIDTGTEVRKVCIRFDADRISGTEALELAGAEPLYQEFGGMGSFVCQLCGWPDPVGECPPAGDHWAYHRAPAGEPAFTAAPVGASSTTVGDGDVEGWRFGRGEAPALASFETICGVVEVPETAPEVVDPAPPFIEEPPPTIDPEAGRPPPSILSPSSTVPTTTTAAAAPTATTATARDSTTTTTTPADPDDTALAAAERQAPDGGSPAALAAVGVLVAGLLGWAWRARRQRAGTVDP